jgi:hypothetical protein
MQNKQKQKNVKRFIVKEHKDKIQVDFIVKVNHRNQQKER